MEKVGCKLEIALERNTYMSGFLAYDLFASNLYVNQSD